MPITRLLFFLTMCFLTPLSRLWAQVDTIAITEIEVVAPSIREQFIGGASEIWNSAAATNQRLDLGSLLNQNGIFIKSYGSNSLATSSIRGASAGHTLVLWNGLPIQSPMLGLLDLSLLPIQSAEQVILQKGGNSAMWGSGAIGGIVALQNKADFNNRLSISNQSSVGSFGQFNEHLQLQWGNKKFQSVTKVTHRQAANDFHYPIAPGFPERKQSNAAFSQQAILQDLYLKTRNGQQWSAHVWQQFSNKEIPPTLVQSQSEAQQQDRATRLILDWKQIRKHIVINSKAAWFSEALNYFDDITKLESRSRFHTYLGEWSAQSNWRGQHLFVGSTYSHSRVQADGYLSNPSENKVSFFSAYLFHLNRFTGQFSLRQELVDGSRIPLIPAMAAEYRLTPDWQLKGKISRNYRLPTFNDRYWIPGGNPDLLPEIGWSEELTLLFQKEKKAFQWQWSQTVFNRNINDWILWTPLDGQSFWSANNISKVWSRGLEERLSVRYQRNNISIQLQMGYDYIRSTNEVALSKPRLGKGEQLWYTPKHQAFGNAVIGWKKLELNYRHFLRSASTGVNANLDAYQTGQFQLQYLWKGARFFASVENVWDVDYFVVERRPMAGRNYGAGVFVEFKRK
jgi:vitamin B12 transporter